MLPESALYEPGNVKTTEELFANLKTRSDPEVSTYFKLTSPGADSCAVRPHPINETPTAASEKIAVGIL